MLEGDSPCDVHKYVCDHLYSVSSLCTWDLRYFAASVFWCFTLYNSSDLVYSLQTSTDLLKDAFASCRPLESVTGFSKFGLKGPKTPAQQLYGCTCNSLMLLSVQFVAVFDEARKPQRLFCNWKLPFVIKDKLFLGTSCNKLADDGESRVDDWAWKTTRYTRSTSGTPGSFCQTPSPQPLSSNSCRGFGSWYLLNERKATAVQTFFVCPWWSCFHPHKTLIYVFLYGYGLGWLHFYFWSSSEYNFRYTPCSRFLWTVLLLSCMQNGSREIKVQSFLGSRCSLLITKFCLIETT